jgi:hypothetical protein
VRQGLGLIWRNGNGIRGGVPLRLLIWQKLAINLREEQGRLPARRKLTEASNATIKQFHEAVNNNKATIESPGVISKREPGTTNLCTSQRQ